VIIVPADAWAETLESFRSCGAGQRECVVYWLVQEPDHAKVCRVVHPVHMASARYYRVDDAWLTRFWLELARTGEAVAAQVHTHGRLASHSPTDDEGAIVYLPGFLSLVLPGFAMRDDSRKGAYLVELDADGRWRPLPPAARLKWL